jgi:hypothetical protein
MRTSVGFMTVNLHHPRTGDFKFACTVELNFNLRVMVSMLRKCNALPAELHAYDIIILQRVAGKI